MSQTFTFLVTVEVKHTTGKFAGRNEIGEAIFEALSDADPQALDGLGVDSGSEYSIESWEVEEEDEAPTTPRKQGNTTGGKR